MANLNWKFQELLIFIQKDSRFQTDSSRNTTLFAWRCNAAALLLLVPGQEHIPSSSGHGCSVPPPADSSSGHKPEGLSKHRAKIPLRATSSLGRLTKPLTVAGSVAAHCSSTATRVTHCALVSSISDDRDREMLLMVCLYINSFQAESLMINGDSLEGKANGAWQRGLLMGTSIVGNRGWGWQVISRAPGW